MPPGASLAAILRGPIVNFSGQAAMYGGTHRGRTGAAGAGAGPSWLGGPWPRALRERHRAPQCTLRIGRLPCAPPARGLSSDGPTCLVSRSFRPAGGGAVDRTSDALGHGETGVQTVEHVLAVAAALQIDDLTIDLDGPEPPIGDWSFAPYLAALEQAGIKEQPVNR